MLWDFYILANKSSIPPKPLTQYHIFGSIGGLKSLTSHKMFFSITFLYCATVVALTILSAKHYVKMVLESAKIINFTCLLDQKDDECIISNFYNTYYILHRAGWFPTTVWMLFRLLVCPKYPQLSLAWKWSNVPILNVHLTQFQYWQLR